MVDPHTPLATVHVAGETYQLLTREQLRLRHGEALPDPVSADSHHAAAVADQVESLKDNTALKAQLGGEVSRTALLRAIRLGRIRVFQGDGIAPDIWFPMTSTVVPAIADTPPARVTPPPPEPPRETQRWLYRTEVAHPAPDREHRIRFRAAGWTPADDAARFPGRGDSRLVVVESDIRYRAGASLVVRAGNGSPPFVYPLGEGLPGVPHSRNPGPVATTLMPVVPVLEGTDGQVPDTGWLYLFRHNRLWRMLKVTGHGRFRDGHHELARKHDTAPHADGVSLNAIWVPLQVNGQRETALDMRYSRTLLPWDQVAALEADPQTRLQQGTDLTPLTAWLKDGTVPAGFTLPAHLRNRPATAAVPVSALTSRALRLVFRPATDGKTKELTGEIRFDAGEPVPFDATAGEALTLDVPETAHRILVQAQPVTARTVHPWHWAFDLREAPDPDPEEDEPGRQPVVYLSRVNPITLPEKEALRSVRLSRTHWRCTELPATDAWKSDVAPLARLAEAWRQPDITETAMPPGWLYVFRQGYLWAEYEVISEPIPRPDPSRVSLRPVNLQVHQGRDERPAQTEKVIPRVTLPVPEDEPVEIAFSHFQWSWARIQSLGGLRPAADPERPDWPWYDPGSGVPPASADPRLADTTEAAMAERRRQRCQVIGPGMQSLVIADPEALLHTAAMRLNTAWSLMEQLVRDMHIRRETGVGVERYLEAAVLTWWWLNQDITPEQGTPWQRDQARFVHKQRLQSRLDADDIKAVLKIAERAHLRELIRAARESVRCVLDDELGDSSPERLARILGDRLALPADHPRGLFSFHELVEITLAQLQTPETTLCRTLQLDDSLAREHAQSTENNRYADLMDRIVSGQHPLAKILSPWLGKEDFAWQKALKRLIRELEISWDAESDHAERIRQARQDWLTALSQMASPPVGPAADISRAALNYIDQLAQVQTREALRKLTAGGQRLSRRWLRKTLGWARNQLAVYGGLLIQTGDYLKADTRQHTPLALERHGATDAPPAPESARAALPERFAAYQVTAISPAAQHALTGSRLSLFTLNAFLALNEATRQGSTRNTLNALSATLDMLALSGEAGQKVAQRLASETPAAGHWLGQLIRHPEWARTFAGRLPVIAGTLGVVVAGMDYLGAAYKGDDVRKAYAFQLVGGGMVTVGTLLAMSGAGISAAVAAVAPPLALLGFALAATGVVLGNTIWHKDDLMALWLEHGPFACARPERRLPVVETRVPFVVPPEAVTGAALLQTSLGPLHQFRYAGIRPCLAVRLAQPPATTLSLYLHKVGILLILDSHYRLLGLMDYRPAPEGRNLRQVIRLNGNGQLSLKLSGQADQFLGTFGQPLAATLDELLEMTRDWRDEPASEPSRDTSGRLNTGLLDRWFGEDEDKYIAPVRQHPKAAAELLLTALYPVEVRQLTVTQEDASQARGNIVITRLSVPYFIEGQSRLIFELRVTGGWIGWLDNLWGVDLIYQNFVWQENLSIPDAIQKVPALVIPSLLHLSPWLGDIRTPGIYEDSKTQELVIVQSFGFGDLEPPEEAKKAKKVEKLSPGQHVIVTARARVIVSGGTTRHGLVPLEDNSVVSLPFRGPYAWTSYKDEEKPRRERMCWSQLYTSHTLGS